MTRIPSCGQVTSLYFPILMNYSNFRFAYAALEEACSELGYSLDELVEILRSGNYPSELLTVLRQRSKCRTNESLLKMLEPQRLALLPKVEEGYRCC